MVWLDHGHLAWKPYDVALKLEPAARDRPLLGLFNNVAKLSPSALTAYANILRRVPEARLVLKYGDRYGVPVVRDRFRRAFADRGVMPDRLIFHERAATLEDHLRLMQAVDLALDSFPYQGTMTSLECLAVGTPIVSRCGEYYAHRATSAMMMRMGLDELVAGDDREYVEIAVQLLHNLDDLRELRSLVLERFYSSSLTDPSGLAKELENVFRHWCHTSTGSV